MRKAIAPIAVILQLGSIILVATLVPLVLGIWVDKSFRTTPWITLMALVVGVVAATTAVYNVIAKQYKKLS